MSSSPKSSHKNHRSHFPLQKSLFQQNASFPHSSPVHTTSNKTANSSYGKPISASNNFASDFNHPCPHLLELRSKLGPDPFRNLQDCLEISLLGQVSVRWKPCPEVVQCGACKASSPRLFACIACAAVSCQLHTISHAVQADDDTGCFSPSSFHAIAVDVDCVKLFCCVCKDHVYDSGLFNSSWSFE